MKHLSETEQIRMLEALLNGSRVSTVVTDPSQEDNPIIYVNNTFETMTGYTHAETLGRNCRFLQGESTDSKDVSQIRNAIQRKEALTIVLKNYKKDGTLFWNRLQIQPFNLGDHLYFISSQTNVSVEYRIRQELSDREQEIEELMLPIMMIKDDLATVALIGEMTSYRFNLLTSKLSEFVQKHAVNHIIIDVTGLYWDDESPMSSLLATQDVMKLMGTQLYITGITPKVAQALASIRQPHQHIRTFSSIQQALKIIQ